MSFEQQYNQYDQVDVDSQNRQERGLEFEKAANSLGFLTRFVNYVSGGAEIKDHQEIPFDHELYAYLNPTKEDIVAARWKYRKLSPESGGPSTADVLSAAQATADSFKQREVEQMAGEELGLRKSSEAVTQSGESVDKSSFEAQIPFMITRHMRRDLASLGYDEESIRKMTPEDAWVILEGSQDDEMYEDNGKTVDQLAQDFEIIQNIRSEALDRLDNVVPESRVEELLNLTAQSFDDANEIELYIESHEDKLMPEELFFLTISAELKKMRHKTTHALSEGGGIDE